MKTKNIEPIKVVGKKKFDGSGSRLINNFLDETSELFLQKLLRFTEQKKSDGLEDHAFWHHERQVKGSLAATLDNVCDGYFLQEPPIGRTLAGDVGSDSQENHGWCDFWCRYGVKRKVDVLIEVKHAWARYYVSKLIEPYAHSIDRHKSAIAQAKSAQKGEYLNDHLFAAALSVVPLFTRQKNSNDPVEMSGDVLTSNLKQACKDFGAHFGYAVPLTAELDWFSREVEKPNGYETYPALMLVWSINKVHRDSK